MRDFLVRLDAARAGIARLRAQIGNHPVLTLQSWWVRWGEPNRESAISALVVAGAYYFGALIGFLITFQSSPISPIWPPNAILLVALLLVPLERWWVCLLAVAGAHLLVELPHGVPLVTATGLYFTNSAEAVLGAWLVRRYIGSAPWLGSLRRVATYLICAVVVAPVATSFADAAVVVLTHWGKHYWLTWGTRCISNSLAQLTIGIALLLVLTSARDWLRDATRQRFIEAALLAGGLMLIGVIAFGGQSTRESAIVAVLPFLLWAAVRFGVNGMSLSLLGITALATWSAVRGHGPFSTSAPANDVISLQLVLIGVSMPMLFLAALLQERKETLQALGESEERYRAVVSNFPEGAVLLFDEHLRHVFADGQGLLEIGVSKERSQGKTLWETFPLDMIAALESRYRAALAGVGASFDTVHADHIYHMHILPVQYASMATGMMVVQDVTEQRQAEALAELNRAKSAFIANMSHEFRTPLTLLLGPVADALADNREPLPPRQRERLALVQHNGLRLHKLVNTLLDFSRIEAGRIQAIYTQTDVSTLTAELASTFRSAIERAGLRLVVDCPPLTALPQPVYVDRDMWENIVLNLLSNALKFTFDGEIAISVRPSADQPDRIELAVRDTGIGIPNAELPHLFERFYRVPGAQARTSEGTGIGLAMIQELVRLHGGTIQVESAIGAGSTFTATIRTGSAHLPASRTVSQPLGATDTRTLASSALGARPFVEEALGWLPHNGDAAAPDGGGDTEQKLLELADTSIGVPDVVPASATAVAPSTPLDTHTAPSPRPRVLVVDDNADMCRYLWHLLRGRYEVDMAYDGEAALAAVHAHRPDIVLSDIMMPKLDGFGLVAALRADPRTRALPIILLSARAGEESTVEGLQAGVDDYMVKPFAARELLARVQTHLTLAQLRGEAAANAAQLNAVFDAMTDGVFILDAEKRTTRLNLSAQRLFGLSSDDIVSWMPTESARQLNLRDADGNALAAEQQPSVRLLRGESLTGATAVTMLLRSHDGQERAVSLTGGPLRDDAGQIVGAVGVFRDVTELRRIETALAEQERLFRTLVENSPDIIARFDRNLRYLYVSPAIGKVAAIPPDEFVGKTNADLGWPESSYSMSHRAIEEVFETRQSRTLVQVASVAEDIAGERYFRAQILPEFAEDGAVASVLTVTSEITDLKRAEEALRAANAIAEAAKREEERRRREAERRERIAESLRDVLTILNSNRPIQKILDYIARQAGRLLHSSATAIFTTDGASDESADGAPATLVLQATYGVQLSHPSRPLHRGARRFAGHAALQRAMAERRPVAVLGESAPTSESSGAASPNAGMEERATEAADYIVVQSEPLPEPYQALLAVPIVAQDDVYGALQLFYARPHRFSAEEVALAKAFGDQIALAIANARLQDHIEQAATEMERNRLARELHDTVTQEIFSASLLAQTIPLIWDQHRSEAERALKDLYQLTRSALAALRALLLELRPADLEKRALADLLRQLTDAMTARTDIPIALSIADDCPPIPVEVKVALYRIVQEALTNAAKHAAAHQISVRLGCLQAGETVQLEVRDDGQGFEVDAVPAERPGIGTMRTRARAVGATLRVKSRRMRGTSIIVEWKGNTDRDDTAVGRGRTERNEKIHSQARTRARTHAGHASPDE